MARIPIYENRQGVSTGSGFLRFRSASDAAGPGNALARLGSQLSGVAEDYMARDKAIKAEAEVQAEKDYRLNREDALLDYDRDLSEQLALDQEGAVNNAPGFTDTYETYATQRAKDIIAERFPGRENEKELLVAFEARRQSYVKQAATFEVDRRISWRDGVLTKKLESLETVIGATASSDPATYTNAAKEWERVIGEQFPKGSQLYQVAVSRGMGRIEKSYLAARAAADKKGFLDTFNGAFVGTPKGDKNFVKIHDEFSTAGVDPKVGAAIFKLESNLGTIDAPIGKDGKPMSSAVGPWQIMKGTALDLGILPSERRNFDVTTPAIAKHLADNNARLEKQGFSVTPGRTYMTWNIGPGATAALLRADPNAEVGSVLRRVWAGKGPRWVAQALRNNPSMYREGQTVGQVLANYENKVEGAMRSTSKYWAGADSDSRAREAVSSFFPNGAGNYIAASDVGEIYEKTAQAYKAEAKDQALWTTFNGIASGAISPRPSDPDYQKAIDFGLQGRLNTEGLAAGDSDVHSGIVGIVDQTRYIPEAAARTLSDTILKAGLENPGKGASFHTLARIANDYPEAWENSKIDGDVKKRVKEFLAQTDVLRLPPAEAIRRIEESYSPEGMRQREAMKQRVADELKQGKRNILDGRSVTWTAIENHFDKQWDFSNVEASDAQKDVAVDAFENAYTYHRSQGTEPEMSQALALKDMERAWGVTAINGGNRLSPAPIEKNYPPVGGSYQWIADEARNYVLAELADRGKLPTEFKDVSDQVKDRATGKTVEMPEVRVLAVSETMDDIRNGKARPRYAIAYRKSDGTVDFVPRRVSFDYDFAASEQRARDIETASAGRQTKDDLDNIIAP